MPGVDESLTFHPLKIAVLTISDTRDEDTDKSGPLLVDRLTRHGHILAGQTLVKDEGRRHPRQLQTWIDDPEVDVVITTGGTGFAPRDVTPEAVKPLFRPRDGRLLGGVPPGQPGDVGGWPTLQSRAFAGQAGDTFIFCLPGSTGACKGRLGPGAVAGAGQPPPPLLPGRPGPPAAQRLPVRRLP